MACYSHLRKEIQGTKSPLIRTIAFRWESLGPVCGTTGRVGTAVSEAREVGRAIANGTCGVCCRCEECWAPKVSGKSAYIFSLFSPLPCGWYVWWSEAKLRFLRMGLPFNWLLTRWALQTFLSSRAFPGEAAQVNTIPPLVIPIARLCIWHFQFSSVQSLSWVRLFATPCTAARPPCPSPTPRVHPNPCPSSRWCHPVWS